MISKMSGVPVPAVPLRDSETTEFAVGATVFAAVEAGIFTKKSLLVISPEDMVANAGAPPVVALRYWPVVPLAIEAKVSAEEV